MLPHFSAKAGSMSLLSKWLRKSQNTGTRESYALDGLDRKLEVYLDFDDGFFIEAGANNGIKQSNTLYFEKHWHWQGLLIEPVPDLAMECKNNRPQCLVENAALVPFDYPSSQIEMRYCDLMSQVKGAMKTREDERQHIKRGCEVQNIISCEIEVPARTLSSILDQHNITSIDLLSLDVEGFELQALQGLDLERHKPHFLLIEARYRENIDAYLSSHYKVLDELSHHDVLYRCIS
jgi:FkbM family methyltransferase